MSLAPRNLIYRPLYIPYQYGFGLTALEQSDIDIRSNIYSAFLSHPKKFLSSLLQSGEYSNDKTMFGNRVFSVAISNQNMMNMPIGTWTDLNGNVGIDIISLYACVTNKNYKNALYEINNHIKSNEIYGNNDKKNSMVYSRKKPNFYRLKEKC